MKKIDLEYEKLLSSERRFAKGIDLAKHLASVSGYLAGIYLLLSGVEVVLRGQSPDGIAALSTFFEAFNLGSILSLVWGGGMTVAYMRERDGKKRAISEKSKYQRMVEQSDAGGRTSSGLTETGDSPLEADA